MRKRKIGRKLSRKRDQRQALLTSLTRELFNREKIETTEAKAKEVSRVAEKLITKLKTKTLASRRLLFFLNPKEIKKFMEQGIVQFKDRKGGYTRVVKLGPRKGNGAKMAFVELVK